jgi:transposase-like protein
VYSIVETSVKLGGRQKTSVKARLPPKDLRYRGTAGCLIAVVDGLKGFPEGITSILPEITVQTHARLFNDLVRSRARSAVRISRRR